MHARLSALIFYLLYLPSYPSLCNSFVKKCFLSAENDKHNFKGQNRKIIEIKISGF